MRENIVLIGAGSAVFTRGLVADLIDQNWDGRLSLVDIDPHALAVAEGLTRKMLEARKSRLTLAATTDRREALKGATVVICTIGVGGRRAWEQDVFIPRKYGIYQPVGDSVMPGGTSRALRMIPAMIAIANDVFDLAPEALFFNYGNPMAPVCRAVRKATGANIVGLCHGVFHVAKYIATALGTATEHLKYTAIGMNHLTWFTEVRSAGRDLMPALRKVSGERLASGITNHSRRQTAGTQGNTRVPSDDDNPFTWQLMTLFGAFPAVMDRHITEFFPHMFGGLNSYYGRTLGIDAYSFEKTISSGDAGFGRMMEIAMSPAPLPDDYFNRGCGEHEQVINIIASIRNDTGEIFSANFPNLSQIPNLAPELIVEAPSVAQGGMLRPIAQSPLPPALAGTLASRFQWVETVVEAAIEGSYEKFVQALLIDGAVGSIDVAYMLADELIDAQKAFLPQFSKQYNKKELHHVQRDIE